jgi:phage terminase small subunit
MDKPMKTLTPKQRKFTREYLATGNASEAYRRAYDAENCKPETICVEASLLLDHPMVALMIDRANRVADLDASYVIDGLMAEHERSAQAEEHDSSAVLGALDRLARIVGVAVDSTPHTAGVQASVVVNVLPAGLLDRLRGMDDVGEASEIIDSKAVNGGTKH